MARKKGRTAHRGGIEERIGVKLEEFETNEEEVLQNLSAAAWATELHAAVTSLLVPPFLFFFFPSHALRRPESI